MNLFKKDYGREGKLSRTQWEALLNSDKGIYKKLKNIPKNVTGPILNTQGHIVNDLMTIETITFTMAASKRQITFQDELQNCNHSAAKEYVLTISNTIKIWKDDLGWIKKAIKYLDAEERLLEEEESMLEKEERHAATLNIPEVIARHFPQLFRKDEFIGLSFKELLKKIKLREKFILPEEQYLKKYLKDLKKNLPFLFE